MLRGRVTRSGEPVVPIRLLLQNKPSRFFATVDTGFNGYLAAPKRLLLRGGWQILGTEKFRIATGAVVEQEMYIGEVFFDRHRYPVFAVATDDKEILIGTKLLRRNILTINFPTKRVLIK